MRTTNPMASLLGHSPFKPMQNHMRSVQQCVSMVPGLFDALLAGDRAGIEAAKEKIFAAEKEADQVKNDLRAHLPKSLFMPVDRRDLLELLDVQDAIADISQDIAGLLVERDMEVFDGLDEPLRAFVQRSVDACAHSARIIEELDELVETGFRGREATQVEELVEQLNAIECETDDMGMALSRLLFSKEDELKPVSVMFWYQLLQWIGELADNAEKVGDRLRLLIAR